MTNIQCFLIDMKKLYLTIIKRLINFLKLILFTTP